MGQFDFKANSFPISSVIDAAQKKAQLEQQAYENGNQQLVQGLNSVGQIGQSLFDQKKNIAQALATGRALGIDDDTARSMGTPENVIKAATVKKSNVDMQMLMSLLHPGATLPSGAVPASMPLPTGSPRGNGAMLASDTTLTPIATNSSQPSPSPSADPLANPTASASPGQLPISAPPAKPTVNKATSDAAIKLFGMSRPEPVVTQADALKAGTVPKGTRIIAPAVPGEDKEQDKLEAQARQGLQSLRGDPSLKNAEVQRDAAISAYNRLRQIEFSGKAPNPVDYVDILGQVYKARTGTAPTETVLNDARQQTAEGRWGKVFTFFTGEQAPATTKAIASSLKDMVAHMGLQADELHDGYMKVHGPEVFPIGLSPDRAARLASVTRGKSFASSTGVKAEDFDPHLQAIKWANDNPNDPRSAPILQKALSEKAASQGGSIGL